jgi:hypothetical protein
VLPRYDNIYRGLELQGGIRWRLASKINQERGPCLNKVSLAKWAASIAHANVHFPHPQKLAMTKPYAALIHLKITQDFGSRVAAAIRENQHWKNSAEYRLYEQWLFKKGRSEVFSEDHSIVYMGVDTLLTEGIISRFDWVLG